MVAVSVHQAGHDLDDKRIGSPQMAVDLIERLEDLHVSKRMLNHNPHTAQPAVVLLLLGGQFTASRLALRKDDLTLRVILVHPLVAAITLQGYVLGQLLVYLRLPPQRQIVHRAGHGGAHLLDPTFAVHHDLGLERMHLLPTRIVKALGVVVLRAADPLLGSVQDGQQPRESLLQHFQVIFSQVGARVRKSAAGDPLHQPRHGLEIAAYRALVQVEKQAQDTVAWVNAQPDHEQQEASAQVMPKLPACSPAASAVGPSQAFLFCRVILLLYLVQHLVELLDAETCERPELLRPVTYLLILYHTYIIEQFSLLRNDSNGEGAREEVAT